MKTQSILKTVSALVVFTAFTACNGSGIEGRWVEPVPGMEGQVQGISLEAGGKASSINMATLQFETWQRQGDRLILSGKSIGNGVTIPFTDTLVIDKLSDSEMLLKSGQMTIKYQKQ